MFNSSDKNKLKLNKRLKKKVKIRSKIKKFEIHRLTVYKSLKHIYAQIYSSDGCSVLVSASSLDCEISPFISSSGNKDRKIIAEIVGEFLAKRSLQKGIFKVAFDVSGFRYHGRIKKLAESARKNGLNF